MPKIFYQEVKIMLKKVTLILVLSIFGLSVFAQENSEDNSQEGTERYNSGRFSFGLNYMFGPKLDMAVGAEFGFLIFRNDTWDIRNNIVFNNYSIMDNDGIENFTQSFSDKIIVGGGSNFTIARPYIFFEGGVGFYSDDSKKYWTTPLAYFGGFGIGFEIFVARNFSFSLDTGVDWQFLDEKIFLFQKFTMGMKIYF
jgi:hypothetical protein